ncbi:MAG: hypothetical protein AAFX78_14670 [Cyanobacteria bacterium J06638_20]
MPTQQQYEDSWFSMRHKDDSIPISEVTNLQTELNKITALQNAVLGQTTSKTNGQTFNLANGKEWIKVEILSTTAQDVKIESAPGAEDIVPLTSFSAGQRQLFLCNYLADGARTLTVTCTNPITIKYFER